MPNANSIIQQEALSIHIFADGFSFCSPSQIDFIPTPKGIQDFQPAFDEFFAYHKEQAKASIQIIQFEYPSTFVPNALFDEKQKGKYNGLYQSLIDEVRIEFDSLNALSLNNVYPFSSALHTILDKSSLAFSLVHYNTLLLEWISKLECSTAHEHQVYVHLQKNTLDVFLFSKSKFLFSNRFNIKNTDEFLYYLFFIAEQFELQDQFDLVFLGDYSPFSAFYKAAAAYHSSLQHVGSTLAEDFELTQHPAPFFIPTS